MNKLFLLMLPLFGAACTPEAMDSKSPIGMANPASTYCIAQGGTLEIRKEKNGEAGYCHLPDGRVVEEWAFFRESQKK